LTTKDIASVLSELRQLVAGPEPRLEKLRKIAGTIRARGGYRWVGLYEVDRSRGLVKNLVWDGPDVPVHPVFPVTKGLTGVAIAERRPVNVGNVREDERYLTALSTTQSEIIVPVFDEQGVAVVGTIDVESEVRDAFGPDIQRTLESCAAAIQPLWSHI
jgi:GAF domain-containing protein